MAQGFTLRLLFVIFFLSLPLPVYPWCGSNTCGYGCVNLFDGCHCYSQCDDTYEEYSSDFNYEFPSQRVLNSTSGYHTDGLLVYYDCHWYGTYEKVDEVPYQSGKIAVYCRRPTLPQEGCDSCPPCQSQYPDCSCHMSEQEAYCNLFPSTYCQFDNSGCTCRCTMDRITGIWAQEDCTNYTLTIYVGRQSGSTEIYTATGRLYRWQQDDGGGGDISSIGVSVAYAEPSGPNWSYVKDVSGVIDLTQLVAGNYVIWYNEIIIYCQESWTDVWLNYTVESWCLPSGCHKQLNYDNFNSLKQVFFSKFPFSLLSWPVSVYEGLENITDSGVITLSMPVVGDVEISFISLEWFRMMLLCFVLFGVVKTVMRRLL